MKNLLYGLLTLAAAISLSIGNAALADPPGLHGKGGAEFPRGLEKNEKTPAGWSHGEKRGWNHHHKHHKKHHHKHNSHQHNDIN